MALKTHATIIDDIQVILGGQTDYFTDAILTLKIAEGLNEFSRFCPNITREILTTTEDSKELNINHLEDNRLWVHALEYRINQTEREWRNWIEHYRNTISMKIDWWPTDADSGIDTDEALDNSETGVDVDADATTAIPVGTIIRVENELMYVTATGTSLTVVRGYNHTEAVAHDTDESIYIPELAYLYVATRHLVPPITDLAGEVDLEAGYEAGARTIHIDGMGETDTLYRGYLFTLENDGSGTIYRLTEDTTLSSYEGDITFTPGLAEDVTDGDDITFKNSTLTPHLETLFINYVAAKAAMEAPAQFIAKIAQGSRSAWSNWLSWARNMYAISISQLERESKRYKRPYEEYTEGL